MPSLLSRFLGKKKNADQSPLLDGEKFEAVPRTTSPSAATFGEAVQRTKSKEKEHDKGKRAKRSSGGKNGSQIATGVPVLSLSLPDAKDDDKKSQGLGVVFESITDGAKTLDDEALGSRRLSPPETLILIQKTSEVLTERGLETLGVMRPHWFASPRQQEIQLKLIHRFLATLSSPLPNVAPSSPTPQSAFETELRYSRDPHDVAAVLRWGLRHLQLEGNSFGSSGSENWYRTFTDSERSGSYPIKAFDDLLVPLLPTSHTSLLRATLDMVSSLAAHSEENGISGNKLSKVLGWWVVSSRNIQGARWAEFYAQWDAAARQFEHLFLAYIRAQDAQSRMPKRLTELVKNYPFAKNRREEDGIYLPRSRFSTRSADALFVGITVDKSTASSRPHPLRLVEDAFRAVAEGKTTGVYADYWEELRKLVSSKKSREDIDEGIPSLNLTTILADESVRLFSLVPTPDGAAAPTLSLFTPLPSGRGRRSLSVGDRSPTSPTANGRTQSITRDSASHTRSTTSPQGSSQGPETIPDWQAFSSSGFNSPSGLSLAASLWDNDTEVSQPTPKKSTLINKRNSKSGTPRRRSADQPASVRPAGEVKPMQSTYGEPHLVTLDEAFIDFWADSLLDSVARTWPTFVVCQLKPLEALKKSEDGKAIGWLIIERVTSEPTRSTPPPPTPIKTSSASARAASPIPSPTTSDGSKSNRWAASTLTATRKRFSFFSSKHESAPVGRERANRKAAKDVKVGEMGEILKEEDENVPNGVKANGSGPPKETKVVEKAQGPPKIGANGLSVSEEVASTKINADTESPAKELSPPKPGLSPIDEQESAKPVPEHPVQDSSKASKPAQVVETQPVVEEASVPTAPSREVSPKAEPTMSPSPAAIVPDTLPAIKQTASTPAVAPVSAPASAAPESHPIPLATPEPSAAAAAVESVTSSVDPSPIVPVDKEVDDAAAPEHVTSTAVFKADDPVEQAESHVQSTEVIPVTEPTETTLSEPQVEIVSPTPAPVEAAQPEPDAAPASGGAIPRDELVQPQAEPAIAPSPGSELILDETSSEVEVVPPHPEAALPQPELPASTEPPTHGPYVHHATIYIPPADDNDLAQVRNMPAVAEDDTAESSADPLEEESAEPSQIAQTTESVPHGVQEPAHELVPVAEDIAKVDVVKEAPAEEAHTEEHPSDATP